MTAIHVSTLPVDPDTLVVVSGSLREYIGLSRDGGYLHHVRPARLEEPIVGEGKRAAGALTCDCRGGQVRGSCYWVRRAEAFEAMDLRPFAPTVRPPSRHAGREALLDGVASFDAPVGAGESVEASRG